jgi:hypothetical protein
MSVMGEVIEAAFSDEYARLKHDGFDKLAERRIDELLYLVYRRGYVRGHADRSREVQQAEEQDRRAGKFPQQVDIRYEAGKLVLDGKDRTPPPPPRFLGGDE